MDTLGREVQTHLGVRPLTHQSVPATASLTYLADLYESYTLFEPINTNTLPVGW